MFQNLIFVRPRLLGYAGAPIVLFTPCFILSIVTAVRILRMHAKIRELRTGEGDPTQTQSTRVVNGGSRLIKSWTVSCHSRQWRIRQTSASGPLMGHRDEYDSRRTAAWLIVRIFFTRLHSYDPQNY